MACELPLRARPRGGGSDVTLPNLRDAGFLKFGWLSAGEQPNGMLIHPSVTPPSGAFVYRTKVRLAARGLSACARGE